VGYYGNIKIGLSRNAFLKVGMTSTFANEISEQPGRFDGKFSKIYVIEYIQSRRYHYVV